MINYRVLTTKDEYELVTDLEIDVWQMSERDAISAHTLQVLHHTGGNVIGAFDGDELVGATVAFATHTGRLWSHIAAVKATYQGQNIGYGLKQTQREWALNNGYRLMSWTFDPLMRRNAHFNLRLLRARTHVYHVNFYGAMNDGINQGLPSDRFEMSWFLDQETVYHAPESMPFLLNVDAKNHPQSGVSLGSDEWVAVAIPYDFPTILRQDKALALSWKHTLRDILLPAFEAGYWAVDFVTKDERCWYALHQV